jgi:hypothetical protein
MITPRTAANGGNQLQLPNGAPGAGGSPQFFTKTISRLPATPIGATPPHHKNVLNASHVSGAVVEALNALQLPPPLAVSQQQYSPMPQQPQPQLQQQQQAIPIQQPQPQQLQQHDSQREQITPPFPPVTSAASPTTQAIAMSGMTPTVPSGMSSSALQSLPQLDATPPQMQSADALSDRSSGANAVTNPTTVAHITAVFSTPVDPHDTIRTRSGTSTSTPATSLPIRTLLSQQQLQLPEQPPR